MSRASEAVLLKDHLKELRLPAMRRDYAECARQARETRASYETFLLDLVSRRGHRVGFYSASSLVNTLVEAREEKQLERVFRKLSRFHLIILR